MCSSDLVESLCVRIAQRINNYQFTDNVHLTCSFGVAKLAENEPIQLCFERADRALYRAKAQGRNQMCIDT